MTSNVNTTSSQNLVPFIRYFENNRIEWKSVASKFDIPEDIGTRQIWLSSQQMMFFLMEMVRQTNQGVGLEVGKLITVAQISPFLEESLNRCRDLGEAIETLIKLMPELSSHVVIWVEKIEGYWYLCHRSAYHPSAPGFDQTEWFRSFALLSMCRLFLGERWAPEHVYMSFPEHLTHGLALSFPTTRMSFAHPYGALRIQLADTFQPIPPASSDVEWSEHIKRLSHTYAILPWFTVDWFAKFLNMSSRTLQRKLAEKGLSLKRLRDESRSKVARTLLGEEVLPPEEVAWRCGYSDLSNFNRAFRAWTGMTPAQYRRLNLKSAQ
ncbi:helix-turn-helix domain-containing protein [Photobacterium sp. DA100]|uniref:helix-turn-helix domain-containing protein n=1 Tax=Photobacterium sp. DA100 TaxID=3027472 RepID=UPI0024795CF7|nr:helix-turn-helix domain-containing protein [Photobacterium sp. DA100]WEM40947.1 helix-turn-helix domain-containing protein [Photobacterium sp. DA100]